jgi:protein-tyrosine phosphatase
MPWCTYEDMTDAENVTKIRSGLYMGSKDGASEPGFDLVVSAAEEWKAEPKRGIAVMYVPLRDIPFDFERYPHEVMELVDVAGRIAEQVRAGRKVLIFCNMGMNRSGLMTALTLLHLGLSPESAINAVRRRHPCALSNDSFVEAIKYAREHRMV